MAPKKLPKWNHQMYEFLVNSAPDATSQTVLKAAHQTVSARYEEFLQSLPPPRPKPDRPKTDPVANAVARTVKRLRETSEEERAEALRLTQEQIQSKMRDPVDRSFGERIAGSISSGLSSSSSHAPAPPTTVAQHQQALAENAGERRAAASALRKALIERLREAHEVAPTDPIFKHIDALFRLAIVST